VFSPDAKQAALKIPYGETTTQAQGKPFKHKTKADKVRTLSAFDF